MHMLVPGAPMDSSAGLRDRNIHVICCPAINRDTCLPSRVPTTPQMCIRQQYQFCVLSTWLPMQVASFSFPSCLDLLQRAFIQYDLVSMAHF
jgi:hypothetical protein